MAEKLSLYKCRQTVKMGNRKSVMDQEYNLVQDLLFHIDALIKEKYEAYTRIQTLQTDMKSLKRQYDELHICHDICERRYSLDMVDMPVNEPMYCPMCQKAFPIEQAQDMLRHIERL
jgi:predicted Zn-ribbon and HTH transcriptional regulator